MKTKNGAQHKVMKLLKTLWKLFSNFVCMCLWCLCVYMFVCLCVHMHARCQHWVSFSITLHFIHIYIIFDTSSLTESGAYRLSLNSCPVSSRDPVPRSLQWWDFCMLLCIAFYVSVGNLFTGLHEKHFTDWALLPALDFFFFVTWLPGSWVCTS